MKILKRVAAALMSFTMLFSATGCGEDTAYAMNVDGMDVRAGLYLYYAVNAYQDAMNVLKDNGEDLSQYTETKELAKKLRNDNIDGKTAEQWIQDKAVQYCADYVGVEREFEKQGLSLTGEELAAIKSSAEGSQQYFGDFFKNAGIGIESVKAITASSYKQNALWKKYYGEGGIKDIKTQDLFDFYAKNHIRIKYISMPLMKEMDFLIDEHNNYVTSISEAAVTTTDESGNTITTPTTAKLTTDIYGNTATTTEETSTDASSEGETTSTAGESDTETTTTTAAETTDDENAETTTAGETGTTDTTDSETETTTTTTDTGYEKNKERILAVSTSASSEKKSAETTAAPTYTPCEKVYTWAVKEDAPLLKPEFIEDEECWYIVLKADIKDRMTEEDLWTSNQIESTRNDLYYKDFQNLMEEWGGALDVKRNEKAFRRYKVLDIDVMGYQNALMMSYYSMYNMQY